MAKNNSSNQDYTNNSDGWDLSGGTTKRKLTVTGGDMTLTGSGANTYTFPASTDTLVGRASTDTLTNKTINASQLVNTSVTASKIDFTTIGSASLNGTVTAFGNMKILSGWSQILGTGTTSITTTVTLPQTLSAVYSVICSPLGYKSGGTSATVIGDFNVALAGNQAVISTTGITTSQFTLTVTTVSGVFGAAYHGFSWIVIGI